MKELFNTYPKVKRNRLPQNPEKKSGTVGPGRFPSWLHRPLGKGGSLQKTGAILSDQRMPTVCEEAKCPNQLECWTAKTATFLALGKECTRACGFCDIAHSHAPPPPEQTEPKRIAESAKQLGLAHIVITMVARDDLPDGGAEQMANIIEETRKINPSSTIEVLTSDFSGSKKSLYTVLEQKPEIFNHNIETTKQLTPKVRHKASYTTTLSVLSNAKSWISKYLDGNYFVKSGIMVGLGETEADVQATLEDLLTAGVDIVTIGQYLQASPKKLRVQEFVHPDQFLAYKEYGESIGIQHMYTGPFVRSSYNAGHLLDQITKKQKI